jgi:hypothetical protein
MYEKYPDIFRPKQIDSYLELNQFITPKPVKPVFDDEEPQIKKDGCSNEILKTILGILIFLISAMILLGSIPSIISGEGDMKDAFVYLLLSGASCGFLLWKINSVSDKKMEKYLSDSKSFKSNKQTYEENYQNYLRLVREYDEENNTIKKLSKEELRAYGLRKYYSIYTTEPQVYTVNYKEGKSEESFFQYLNSIFKDKVYKNLTITCEDRDIEFYLPDICFYNKDSGICIDIEIDEQFDQASGNIIHKKLSQHDYKRNNFFVNNGWFVIRFAETQVENDMLGCAVIIFGIIQKYDPVINYIQPVNLHLLKNSSPVSEVHRW